MEFAYSLAMYAPPDHMYRRQPRFTSGTTNTSTNTSTTPNSTSPVTNSNSDTTTNNNTNNCVQNPNSDSNSNYNNTYNHKYNYNYNHNNNNNDNDNYYNQQDPGNTHTYTSTSTKNNGHEEQEEHNYAASLKKEKEKDKKDKKKHRKSTPASTSSSLTTTAFTSTPPITTTTKSRIPGRRRAASATPQAFFQKAAASSSSHRHSRTSSSSASASASSSRASHESQYPQKTTQAAHPVSHLATLFSSSSSSPAPSGPSVKPDGNGAAATVTTNPPYPSYSYYPPHPTLTRRDSTTPVSAFSASAASAHHTSSASASASASTPVPASERLPASPKTPKFIRSAHTSIFGNYHRQHHHRHSTNAAPHHHQNKLHKRDSIDHQSTHHSISIPQPPPPTPTSPYRIPPFLDGPLPPFPFESKHYDVMPPEPGPGSYMPPPKFNSVFYGTESGSSASGTTSSNRTVMTSNENLPPSSAEGSVTASSTSTSTKPRLSLAARPFITRHNRAYINESTLLYPLPVDLQELHRQSLRTLMLFQLFGGPTTAPEFSNKPPTRVLEVGCGSAFWSMMCHRYFAQHGHSSISFTGIDIVPLVGSTMEQNWKPDKDMRWRFIQHDLRRMPWPLADNEFDLVLVKDMSMVSPSRDPQSFFEEYLRLLKPGGVLEIWESDHTIRMLRPHVLRTPTVAKPADDSDSDSSSDEEDDTARLGAYVMTNNTPLSAPLNPFLVEYNGWATKALDARGLSAVPCTIVGPYLLQEADTLMEVRSKRLAVPLSEIRWEREGVGGVVTKDGKSYIDSMKGKGRQGSAPNTSSTNPIDAKGGGGGKTLTTTQAALRRTALETTVGMILCLEPILREASGKSQDEWDSWAAKMMNDLLREGGTSWGECMEVGAWCARKKLTPSSS